jgi:hypothetical protein
MKAGSAQADSCRETAAGTVTASHREARTAWLTYSPRSAGPGMVPLAIVMNAGHSAWIAWPARKRAMG